MTAFSDLNHLKISAFSSRSLKLSLFPTFFPSCFPIVPRFSRIFPGFPQVFLRSSRGGPRLSHGARHEEIGHAHLAPRLAAADQRLGAWDRSRWGIDSWLCYGYVMVINGYVMAIFLMVNCYIMVMLLWLCYGYVIMIINGYYDGYYIIPMILMAMLLWLCYGYGYYGYYGYY